MSNVFFVSVLFYNFFSQNLLLLIFLLIFFNIVFLFLLPDSKLLRHLTFGCSCFVFILASYLLVMFYTNSYNDSFTSIYQFSFEFLNLYVSLGLDGISIFFFILSSLLILLCILFILEEPFFRLYAINLLFIELFLLLVFSILDILFFYIFFEAILIPMFIIIGIWGSRERKIRAIYLFFFYTFIGSLCMLLGILYIYSIVGTLNLQYIIQYSFTETEQQWLWIAFFFSFSAKIPMFPFHVWLPEAHVEAPTVGSVLLAGILLKLGVYGFLRFSLLLFPMASNYFAPLVYLLCILGIVTASLTALRQTDLKRIIAYSSIAHMNLVTLGIFSFNSLGLEGSILQSISHGFVSGGLFFLVGILYNRYHSRLIHYYSGLCHVMPNYSIIFLIFTLANIALPGTSSFVGEFLILASLLKINFVVCFLSTSGVILCGGYALWVYNRLIFGNLKNKFLNKSNDLVTREMFVLIPLLVLILFTGIKPSFFINFLHYSILNVVLLSHNF